MTTNLLPPSTQGVSADALSSQGAGANSAAGTNASAQDPKSAGTTPPPADAGTPPKKVSLKDKIANFVQDSKDDSIPPTASHQRNPVATDPTARSDDGTPPPAAPRTNDEPKDFKTLKAALDQKDAKVAELEAELNKVRPNAERVATLEAELEAKKKDYEEIQEFRAKTGLINSNEFNTRIVQPRQNIAAAIKKELVADGIDENVWEAAQRATSRKELEDIVNENVESSLLKTQFYQLFFQDLELRKAEEAALAAPARYLQTVRDQEIAQRNQTKEMTTRNFQTTWSQALTDATEMATKLGENKLIETIELPGNDEHNTKVVKPILEAAHAGAQAMLQERIELGLPVTREDAARTIYLWRQAIAAQAANMDRMRWFRHAQTLEKQVTELTAKLEAKVARNNPTPGGRPAGTIETGFKRGSDLKSTISNFAESFKSGEV